MSTLQIYADNIPSETGYSNGSGNGFFWHDAVNEDPAVVRQALGSAGQFEAAFGGGNVVTDWFDGWPSFNGLARGILSFDTSVLAGYTWTSIKLYMAPEGVGPQEGYWLATEKSHLVKMTGIATTPRAASDFEITHFGSNVNQYTDQLVAADSAAYVLPVTQNVHAASTVIDETKLPMNTEPGGITQIGLLANSDISGTVVGFNNVNHWWGPDATTESYRPYLLVEGLVRDPITESDSGSGAEAVGVESMISSKSVADSGSGNEASAVTAAASAVDSGAFAEAGLIDFGLPENEVVSIEELILKAPTDSGAAAELIASIEAILAVVDSGAGAEIANGIPNKSAQDSGEGTEVGGIVRDWDSIGITAAAAVTDSGALVEVWRIERGAEWQEVLGIAAQASLSDSGQGQELESLLVALSQLDSGAAVEAMSLDWIKDASDSGLGADVISAILNALTIPDTGQGAETPEIETTLTVNDTGLFSEAITRLLDRWEIETDQFALVLTNGKKSVVLINSKRTASLINSKREVEV